MLAIKSPRHDITLPSPPAPPIIKEQKPLSTAGMLSDKSYVTDKTCWYLLGRLTHKNAQDDTNMQMDN